MPASALALQQCADEPIHLLGRTQRFGVLLAFDRARRVVAVSGNVRAWCGLAAKALLGSPIGVVLPRRSVEAAIAHARVAALRGQAQHLHRVSWPGRPGAVDVSVHQSGEFVVIEAEPSGSEPPEAALGIENCTRELAGLHDVPALARSAATAVARITGYDRVMVYRFAADGSGTVVAEHLQSGQASYLGLRYPASDIPPQARRLYLRNPTRVIADARDIGMPVLTQGGRPLDLSLATLRSVSAVHLEYMRNMGTAASMSISLIVDGQLWGLIACHHRRPFRPSLACRAMGELLGRLYSLALARAERQPLDQDIRRLLVGAPGVDGLLDAARDAAGHRAACAAVAKVLGLTGVTTRLAGRVDGWGQALAAGDAEEVLAALAGSADRAVIAVESLAERRAGLRRLGPQVAGLLALPLGGQGQDWVLLLRDEIRRHVQWAGNPDKALSRRPDGRLSPRHSFASWRAAVRAHCEPWTRAEIELAQVLRARLIELKAARAEQRAAEDARQAGEQQALLVRELNHRVRNMLGLIQGLVQQTARDAHTVEELTRRLHDRVHALSRAYSQVEQAQWRPSSLRRLLLDEASAFAEPGQLELEGPEVLLEPQAYLSFAMVVHELATNARKYGALSVPEGRLAVRWHTARSGDLELDWLERGGPAVSKPRHAGFGMRVILQGLEHHLNGHAHLDFEPTGLHARLCTPRGFVAPAASLGQAAPGAPAGASSPAAGPFAPPAVVLVVEDDLVIALLAETLLMKMGCRRVLMAGTAADALRLLASERVDLALLDVNLGDHTSEPVALQLGRQGVPFLVTTGYSGTDAVPEALRHRQRLCKPYAAADLAEAMAAAQAG